MLKRKPHPKIAHATNMGMIGGHIAYYGAAAFHVEALHAVAAGIVLFLLIVGLMVGPNAEVE